MIVLKGWDFYGLIAQLLEVLLDMSTRGSHRAGSGRKKIHASKAAAVQHWQRGHRRIWVDNVLYSSWVSARLKGGYKSDSEFVAHLLGLEFRRR